MSKKNKALKWLLILMVFLAVCMYFSRTIQTITTPKVKLTQASTGRIEQKTPVEASAYFPVKTDVTLVAAKTYPITVDKVYLKPGLYVKEGDVVFTANVNDFDQKQEELLKSYNEKAQALIDLDIANRKSSKQSMQNDLYDLMIEKQDALSDAEKAARLAAAAEGVDLTFQQDTWLAKAKAGKCGAETIKLIEAAALAKTAFDTARADFFASYENKKIKISDEVFTYIKQRNTLGKEMETLSDDMVKLLEAKQTLDTVTATSDGYILSLNVKTGDVYEGAAPAYTIAKSDTAPMLRADLTDLKLDVAEGARVEVDGDYDTYKSKVTAVVEDQSDGRKYAEIELTDDILHAAGGMNKLLENGSTQVKLVFRSKKNATIIPSTALHNDGSSEYIFLVDYKYGGFLSASGMVAKRMNVTVIDRSDTAVSIQETIDYQSIIDRADRAVEDGKPVMEYSD